MPAKDIKAVFNGGPKDGMIGTFYHELPPQVKFERQPTAEDGTAVTIEIVYKLVDGSYLFMGEWEKK